MFFSEEEMAEFALVCSLPWALRGGEKPQQPRQLAGLAQPWEVRGKGGIPASHSCLRQNLRLPSLPLARSEVCSPLLCTSVALSSLVCSSDKSHRQTLPARRAVAVDCDMFVIQAAFLSASVISWSFFKFAYFSNLSPSPLCSVINIMSFSSLFLTFPYAN